VPNCALSVQALRAWEDSAERIVRYLYDVLRSVDGTTPACALVRLFVTIPYSGLEPGLQTFARTLIGAAPSDPRTKCLTLLATAGEEPAWNSRHTSNAHKALPLVSEATIARSPMIAQLISQLGVETGRLLASDPDLVVDTAQHTFNVFHVPVAAGSPYIPAQSEFVAPHDIRSVLGFGGLLPTGDLFAVILFSRVAIARESADLFKTLSLNVKLALLPHAGGRMFA